MQRIPVNAGLRFFDAVVRTKVAAKWCIVVYRKTNVGHMSPSPYFANTIIFSIFRPTYVAADVCKNKKMGKTYVWQSELLGYK